MHLNSQVTFALEQTVERKSVSKGVALTNLLAACQPKSRVLAWIEQYETTLRFVPTLEFHELRYVWTINGKALDNDGSGHLLIETTTRRYDPATLTYQNPTNAQVAITYGIGAGGQLRLQIPASAGNFDLQVSCRLRKPNGESHPIYSRHIKIESEQIDGNEAYQEYQRCVRRFWQELAHKVRELLDTVRIPPQRIPNFDPADNRVRLESVVKSAEAIILDTKQFSQVKR